MNNKNDFLVIFANCILVRGVCNSLIMDLQRSEIYSFSSDFFDMFISLQKKPFQTIIKKAKSEKKLIFQLKDFIINNDLGFFTQTPKLFPPIDLVWDSPFSIQNSIIDIGNNHHDYDLIINQLNELNCRYIQFRFFLPCTIFELENLLIIVEKYSFFNIEIIIQYQQLNSENKLRMFVEKHPIISNLFVMSSPNNYNIKVGHEDIYTSTIIFLKQQVNSCESCGNIKRKTFVIPNIQLFTENVLFNNCLNRKISIDVNGMIKNCPSLNTNYGHYSQVRLKDVIILDVFQQLWKIKKDDIKVCKDCEFRYICTDCRAYLQDSNDIYSQPAKCNYNPYIAKWEGEEGYYPVKEWIARNNTHE